MTQFSSLVLKTVNQPYIPKAGIHIEGPVRQVLRSMSLLVWVGVDVHSCVRERRTPAISKSLSLVVENRDRPPGELT